MTLTVPTNIETCEDSGALEYLDCRAKVGVTVRDGRTNEPTSKESFGSILMQTGKMYSHNGMTAVGCTMGCHSATRTAQGNEYSCQKTNISIEAH